MQSPYDAAALITLAGNSRKAAFRYYKLMQKHPRNFQHILRYVEHSARAEECELKIRELRREMGL